MFLNVTILLFTGGRGGWGTSCPHPVGAGPVEGGRGVSPGQGAHVSMSPG